MGQPIHFGKYLLLERVNVGGMAEVFKAKTFGVEGFERILAIKRILPNMADDDEFINMFVDEARIAVQLSHANVVQIYELGKFENQYYIAMEYVAGKDMRQILDRFRKRKELLPIPAAAFIISKICDGLDYAHRKTDPSGRPMNVIHRDVSPQNILVSFEGAVKVTDFGIAKAEDRASKTQAGVLKGKFGYMSPEQVRGMEIDRRSDIFAVGILLYELVTGKRLFVGESDFSTLEKVRNAEVEHPQEANPDVPDALAEICMKALARERDERYEWASDLHDDLQQFLIEDNTIFNAKKLAALMHDEYSEDIAAERSKMEEFMRIQAPAGFMDQQFSSSGVSTAPSPNVAQATGEWQSAPDANENERTMIFETGALDMSGVGSQPGVPEPSFSGSRPAAPMPMGHTGSGSMSHSRPSVSVVATNPRVARRTGAHHRGSNRTAIMAALAALILLSGVLVWILMPGSQTGTVFITSTPQQVDVYLDGKLIASETPHLQKDVDTGKHTISAKAEGFKAQGYEFELFADVTQQVKFQLEPQGGSKDATLLVLSDPIGAEVYIAGAKKGETPLTIKNQDSGAPLLMRLSKKGYEDHSETIIFSPAEKRAKSKSVSVMLNEAGAGSKQAVAQAVAKGKISVESNPSGATVYLASRKVGTTPMEIPDLDLGSSHSIEINKSGYRRHSETVRFEPGKDSSRVSVELQAAAPRKVARVKKPAAPSCGGTGAKLSVMALGADECKVVVGKDNFGVAPIFKKDAPVGSCAVKVSCAGGKTYKRRLDLKKDGNEKVIIKPDMWN